MLGLTILDVDPHSLEQRITIANKLESLRLGVELREMNAETNLYEATVPLRGSMSMWGVAVTNLGVFICGMEPLPCEWPSGMAGVVARYPQGKNVFPVKNGRLVGNREYKIRIRVLEPISLTNQGCFWIYSARPKRWWDSIPGPWRRPSARPK